jgi:hypothetical protein
MTINPMQGRARSQRRCAPRHAAEPARAADHLAAHRLLTGKNGAGCMVAQSAAALRRAGRTATGSTVITAASFARRSGCSGWWPELPDSPAVRPIPPEAHTEMPRHDSSRSCSFACSLAASHRRLDGRETRHWLWAGVEMMQRLKPGITKRDQTT